MPHVETVAVMGDGAPIESVTLATNAVVMEVLSYGAAIHDVRVPDHHGHWGSVHLHFADVAEHLDPARNPHLGGSIGRYANRIGGAAFPLDGRVVHLEANEGANHLHGGAQGFDRCVWTVTDLSSDADVESVTLQLVSPDGDAGYPGTVTATATYRLQHDTLTITYCATTDAPTVVNLTNHGYWNLGATPTVGAHRLSVSAAHVLPVDDAALPTGAPVPVDGTDFDLRAPVELAALFNTLGGLDHCYVLDGPPGQLRAAAFLDAPDTGRWLRVRSDQLGLQVYTGNKLRAPLPVHGSVSLEPQHLPDTPNHPEYGSAVLRPGQEYMHRIELQFGVYPPALGPDRN